MSRPKNTVTADEEGKTRPADEAPDSGAEPSNLPGGAIDAREVRAQAENSVNAGAYPTVQGGFKREGNDDGGVRNFHPMPGECERTTPPNDRDTAPETWPGGPPVPIHVHPVTGENYDLYKSRHVMYPDGSIEEDPLSPPVDEAAAERTKQAADEANRGEEPPESKPEGT